MLSKRRIGMQVVLLLLLSMAFGRAWADFTLPYGDQGNELDVKVVGGEHQRGPLFLWFTNQYGRTTGAEAIAHALARRGATVWMVDLLDSLLLQRSNEVVRGLNGKGVAALMTAGVKTGRPVTVVGLDRMAVPILRGLRDWQASATNPDAITGAVLLFPNLYRGTPVAGEPPSFLGIVAATNMPVMILEPERGVNRNRLGSLLDALQGAGSPTFARIIPDVRDYFPLHLKTAQNASLKNLPDFMKPEEAKAMQALPNELLESSTLLAQAPHSAKVLPLDHALDKPIQQRFGLIPVTNQQAKNFALPDLNGNVHRLVHGALESRPAVTLVNFWASWCPHCIQEIPSMNRLAESYPEGKLRVLSINFKESTAHVRHFMKQFSVHFPVLIDRQGDVAAQWGVFAFPSSFLVDDRGRILYSVNASIDWDTPKVKALIDQIIREEKRSAALAR
ncbi:TlpA family protein disulfide reductase [Halothiobacillus neapolitanus]|uniref:Alkyl hydroperoxide reductase/ Thiol specific antioxidant/ Mal allergen n=1 Tax=Halothiobacillus neapolitanus (strain ATCC 23641 / DSM 15147 / CIP 104769 / NCIMB 8539 / c2) TaxID=555778 RepID=D0L1Y4_HALNC|nr:TlpA disulfide reductase family protein [Halothiobacillus neapolitanus]ACX96707.1 alkyl hydroperoxide reductase/ Thiol specific antioxidant/ Mal allergen [Halothiobacillus neapolitanus c2]TDN65183.1 peroxiredoxin [Halothiobacillus neapolitanus]